MPYRVHRTKPCPNCAGRCSAEAKQCARCVLTRAANSNDPAGVPVTSTPAERIERDRELARAKSSNAQLRKQYGESLRAIERLETEVRTVAQLRDGLETYEIQAVERSGTGEATAIVVASDWHSDEAVGAEVGGLNVFNADVAEQRIQRFFRKADSLTRMLAQDIRIPTMVLALLGDFISNDIHDELVEQTDVAPMHALVRVQNHIISGIEYLLKTSDRRLVIPCHSGNHARTTKTTRFATENGHSLEYLMYVALAAYFRAEPRVTFVIPEGPHSYVSIYDQTIRFQHGHMVKYGGGIGGLTIPLNKAIAQWSKARHADLDVLGHFHQLTDGGNFVVNGSLIGYNAFALSIKASYEKPKQALFLMDRKRGRTCMWPILV